MSKSLLYRTFGLGRIPGEHAPSLKDEGIVHMEEGIRCRIHYRNYRAPGKRFIHKQVSFPGSLVITRRRFAAYTPSRPLINVPLDDPRIHSLRVDTPAPGVLRVAFNAGDFSPRAEGRVECRFRTHQAKSILDLLSGSY